MGMRLNSDVGRFTAAMNVREGNASFAKKDPKTGVFDDAMAAFKRERRKGKDKFDALCVATKVAEDLAGERGLTQAELSSVWLMIQENA